MLLQGLGKRIRALRDKHQLSQQDMADRLRISRQWYGKIENGKADPTATRLQAIAQIFDVPTGALFPRRTKPTAEEERESTEEDSGRALALAYAS